MTMHSFDPDVAAVVGVVPAVIYQSIIFWHARAVANGKHQHDGRTWIYNSVKAWAALFPYLSPKQIRSALERLEDAGFVVTGCYNQTPYDRTKWYCPVGQHDLPSRANRNGREGKPIPDIKPEIKPDDVPQPSAAAPTASKPTASRYRWEGTTIRLNEVHFNRWQESYQPLHLSAHLEEIDAWISAEGSAAQRKDWFHCVSAILKKRAQAERDKGKATNDAPKPKRPQSEDMMELCYGPEFGYAR